MPEIHVCQDCSASFKTLDALGQHKNAKHYQAPAKTNSFGVALKKHKAKLLIVFLLLILGGGMAFLYSQADGSSNGPVAFPERLSNQPMHLHPNLDIVVDGQRIVIPADVGVGVQHEPIHTHAADGVVHVESPDTRAYTLGNFFSIWNKRFDSQCVGEYCGTVEMTVDGLQNTEFGNHVLKDGERIVLQINTQTERIKNVSE